MSFWTAAGEHIPATVDSPLQLNGTHDWTKLNAHLDVSALNAAYIRVECRLSGTGTAWFDDVQVVRAGGCQ
jgi:hypothetical protein